MSDHSAVQASGSWTDSVYISLSPIWDLTARLLGRQTFTGTLTQGQSYTNTLTATIPGLAPGHYFVLVRTNIYNSVYEGVYAANNTNGVRRDDHGGRRRADHRRPAEHDPAARAGAAVPGAGARGRDAAGDADGGQRAERQHALYPLQCRADARRLRRDIQRPDRGLAQRADPVHQAGHLLHPGAWLFGPCGGDGHHAAGAGAAARHHEGFDVGRRRRGVCDDHDYGRAVQRRGDGAVQPAGDRRVHARQLPGDEQHHDHRRVRLHGRAARQLRRDRHQPGRQPGDRAVRLPGAAGGRAGRDDRHWRQPHDPRRRQPGLLDPARQPRQPRCGLHLFPGRRAAAGHQLRGVWAALPDVLVGRVGPAGQSRDLGLRQRAVFGDHGDHEHQRAADHVGLPC